MAERPKSLLDEALDGWRWARQGVVDEVNNLPAGQFDFRPTPQTRSVAELVQHVVESGLMMSGELSRPNGDFTRQAFPKFLQEYAGHVGRAKTKEALLKLLKTTHAQGEKQFRAAGELGLLQHIKGFDGQPITRLAWMHHGVAHEEYHRGQLALYARLMGRVPALTKLIEGS